MKNEDPYYRKNLDHAKKIASEKLGFELSDSQCITYTLNRFVKYEEWNTKHTKHTEHRVKINKTPF